MSSMKGQTLIWLLTTLLLTTVFPATAQQPTKVPRIGYLSPGDSAGESARAEAIWLALHELGHLGRFL